MWCVCGVCVVCVVWCVCGVRDVCVMCVCVCGVCGVVELSCGPECYLNEAVSSCCGSRGKPSTSWL